MLVLNTAVFLAVVATAMLGFTEVEQHYSRLFSIDDELRGSSAARDRSSFGRSAVPRSENDLASASRCSHPGPGTSMLDSQ